MTAPAPRGSHAAPAATPDPRTSPRVPAGFDFGSLAAAGAVAVLLAKSLGAALGEPAAEDFDFLRHVVLGGHHSWLDGGGSLSFWRPLAQQAYYGLLGPLMLDHPRVVAALHFALLAATAVLLHRLLRTWWPAPAAAAAAAFPFLAESARSLLAWPGQFADLGCLFFSVLALHAAARRRLVPALAALAAALLCKEQAVVTAVLLPWLPAAPRATPTAAPAVRGKSRALARPPREKSGRPRWLLASTAVAVAWAIAYAIVRRTAGLTLPHGVESDLATRAVPVARRVLWAFTESGRAAFGLPIAMTGPEVTWSAALLVAALVSTAVLLVRPRAALRGPADRALALWGLAWFALSAASLTAIFPLWSPVRSVFGAVGLGVLLVAAWRNVHPALVAALLAVKLVMLLLAPPPPATITAAGPANGDFMDFARIARLQRLMAETRAALRRELPRLPARGVIGESSMPREAVYAFGGGRAVQAWYRDTTLRWVRVDEAVADPSENVRGIVQFQLHGTPQVAVVDARALRALLASRDALRRDDVEGALAELAAADSLQRDPGALAFRADVMARRAYAWARSGRGDDAVAEARRAVRLSPENRGAHLTLASILEARGETAAARAELDTILRRVEPDADVERLRRQIEARAATPRDSTR